MGAYAYCRKCDCGIAAPTLEECIEGGRNCPWCETRNETTRGEAASAARDLIGRLARVERVLAVLVPEPPA